MIGDKLGIVVGRLATIRGKLAITMTWCIGIGKILFQNLLLERHHHHLLQLTNLLLALALAELALAVALASITLLALGAVLSIIFVLAQIYAKTWDPARP